MKICAIIVNWNGQDYLDGCLKSLRELKITGQEFEIIVVDNDSTDDSVAFITKNYPDLVLIRNPQNVGFAEGCNVGLRHSLAQKANFSWIIDPRLRVAPESLSALLETSQKYFQAGIISPKIFLSSAQRIKNQIWYVGGQIDWTNLVSSRRGANETDVGQFDYDTETDFATGISMFIRNKLIDQVGFFDSVYFIDYAEIDFCERAKKHNWKVMLSSQSIVWLTHPEVRELTPVLRDYYSARNRLIFGFRHGPLRTKFTLLKEAVQTYLSGRPWQRRGVLDFFTGNLGTGSYQP